MKPLFKWLLVFAGLLLLLAVVLAIAVVTLVKPEQYRAAIADAVQGATGRALTLDGPIGLALFPCCAIELERAALGNPPGFPAEPLVQVKSARLAIRLWPLLSRRVVEIGNVRFDGLEANLIGRKDGSNNWNFAEAANPSVRETPEPGATGVSGFSVAGISIRDAVLNYRDDADGSHYRVEQMQVATGEIRGAASFDLATSLRLTNLTDNSVGTVQLKSKTTVTRDRDVTTLHFTGLQVDLDTKGLASLDALSGTMQAPELTARLASDTRVTAPQLILNLQLKGAAIPGGAAPVKAQISDFSYDVDAGTGVLGHLIAHTDFGGIALGLDGTGRFGESSDLSGTLNVPAFSPRAALKKFGQSVPDTADPGVLKALSGTTAWFLKGKVVGLANLAVVLDETKISGSLSRELLAASGTAKPRTRFDLNLDHLNADRYLGPDVATGGEGKAATAKKPAALPNAMLRSLNLEGRARFGQLTLGDVQLADVDLTTSANGGHVRLAPLAAKLYGGNFRGDIRLDATEPKTRVDLEQSFSGVNLGALLTDFAGIRNVTGTMTLKLDGTALGNTDDELLQDLAGNLSFALTDGVYKGMDIWYEIRRARALLRRTPPPARTGAVETPINALEMTGKLAGGTFKTDRFNAEIPFLRVSGSATVDLPRKTLDSDLEALVFEKPVFADDNSLADLENLRIPLTVSGPVASPKVRVDLSRLLKETAKQAVREKLLDRLGLGKPADAQPPTDDATPPNKEDPVKKALDRLFKR